MRGERVGRMRAGLVMVRCCGHGDATRRDRQAADRRADRQVSERKVGRQTVVEGRRCGYVRYVCNGEKEKLGKRSKTVA